MCQRASPKLCGIFNFLSCLISRARLTLAVPCHNRDPMLHGEPTPADLAGRSALVLTAL
jgi:hypothetical protein